MPIKFDIDQDELPIFLAETDEQLQVLDEGLIKLEQAGDDSMLVNELFRAAHTLKGSAGMISHKRMVTVTHALENALDGLRKGTFSVSAYFIDLCLETVDGMRALRDEVVNREESDIDVEDLAEKFTHALHEKTETGALAGVTVAANTKEELLLEGAYRLHITISSGSIASAARAMLVILTLKEHGSILRLQPTQEEIDTAMPVHYLQIDFKTDMSPDKLKNLIFDIGEIENVAIETGDTTHGMADKWAIVKITKDSIASAARALQVVLALQEIVQIIDMEPGMAQIETAKPVDRMKIRFTSDKTDEQIKYVIENISDIENVVLTSSEENRPEEQKEVSQPVVVQSEQIVKAETNRAAPQPTRSTADKTIRTSVERMDNMMNLVGELITDRNRLMQLKSFFEINFRGEEYVETLGETVAHLGRITDQLQKEVMDIRMSPISNVFHKFPRMVRDLSKKFNKSIDLVIAGEDTELDRTVVEEITDPLIHLIRNSIDHAIETPDERRKANKNETGKILLDARHEEGRIIITVEDDGKGIDTERVKKKAIAKGLITEAEAMSMSHEDAVNLIFNSGLSTANTVSDISGRGVGLDIVRNNIQRLNGTLVVETWQGKGTRFQITLPLTLAIVPTLLVLVGEMIFAVPLITVSSTLRVLKSEIKKINRVPVIKLRDKVLPLLRLSEVFAMQAKTKEAQYEHIVVVGTGSHQIGLVVDHLIGQEEVVVKSLGPLVGDVHGIASAAILGDGKVILIIDVQDLYRISSTKLN